eukprot:1677260-Pyramimonas_sp.AAC.2
MGGGRGEPSRTRARVHLGLLEEPRVQEAQVYSHNGPIRHGKRRYVLTTDQSDTGSAVSVSGHTHRLWPQQVVRVPHFEVEVSV